MAVEHPLTSAAWTDLGALPLAVHAPMVALALIDYASGTGPGPTAVGIPLQPGHTETCLPVAADGIDPRHVWARAADEDTVVLVIEGYTA